MAAPPSDPSTSRLIAVIEHEGRMSLCNEVQPPAQLVLPSDRDAGRVLQTSTIRLPEKFDEMSYAQTGLVLFSLGLCVFLYAIDQTIVATAVSNIGIGVKAKGSLTWITTSYLLTTTVVQPLTGRLSEVLGSKRMLLGEVWIFILGSIIAGTAHSLPQLVAGRLISGVGGAGLLSLSTIIVSQLTHERQRSSYLNFINAVFIIADSNGPIIGGLLAKSGNWRWIFLLNTPIGPIITAILIYSVHVKHVSPATDIRSTLRSLDLLGMGLLISWLTLLIIALNLGGDAYPWNSSIIVGLLVGTGCAFVGFVVAENYALHPVVPMGLFVRWTSRNVPIITIARTLLFFHLFASTFYVPIFLQVAGKSSILAAALVIPFLLMAGLSSIISNYISTKYGFVRPPFLFGLAVLPIGMGLMSTLDVNSSIGEVVAYTLICGFGFGTGTTTTMVIPQVGLPSRLLPTVTAFISATPNLGGVLGVGTIGTIINNEFRSKLIARIGAANVPKNINDVVTASRNPVYGQDVVRAYVSAFHLGFRTLAGVAVFQFLLCLLLGRVVLQDTDKQEDMELSRNIDSDKSAKAVKGGSLGVTEDVLNGSKELL